MLQLLPHLMRTCQNLLRQVRTLYSAPLEERKGKAKERDNAVVKTKYNSARV